MNGIPFEGSREIGAGDNPNTNPLHVRLYKDPVLDFQLEQENLTKPEGEKQGPPGFLVSCFELNDNELETIKATKKIWLAIMCHPQQPTMPPVSLSVYTPSQSGYEPVTPSANEVNTPTQEGPAE